MEHLAGWEMVLQQHIIFCVPVNCFCLHSFIIIMQPKSWYMYLFYHSTWMEGWVGLGTAVNCAVCIKSYISVTVAVNTTAHDVIPFW